MDRLPMEQYEPRSPAARPLCLLGYLDTDPLKHLNSTDFSESDLLWVCAAVLTHQDI